MYTQMVPAPLSLSLRQALGAGNPHSKDRGGNKEPLIVEVQLMGQLAITSFRKIFPNSIYFKKYKMVT